VVGRAEATPPHEHAGVAAPCIGVLAVQGDFEAHGRALERLGAEAVAVRRPEQLGELDGLIIPGGESTTISMGLDAYGLAEPIREFARDGRPLFGTCAGMILLDRNHLGVMDIETRRNAFGRQVRSFETEVAVRGLGDEALRAVFIRAPWIELAGEGVQVLAEIDGRGVVARERNVLVAAFHPELTDDLRMHALFLSLGGGERRAAKPDRSVA
jgi:pyridoxal 5'-phosphate synthase pdxT subunit